MTNRNIIQHEAQKTCSAGAPLKATMEDAISIRRMLAVLQGTETLLFSGTRTMNIKVTIIPIVIGAFGTVTKGL